MELKYLKAYWRDFIVRIVVRNQQKDVPNVNQFGIVLENVRLRTGRCIN